MSSERAKLQHSCPHCGASYSVRDRETSASTYHTAVCSVCGDVMAEWEGKSRQYRRNRTALDPDRRTTAIISIVRQAASAPRVKKGGKQSIQRNYDNRKVRKGRK